MLPGSGLGYPQDDLTCPFEHCAFLQLGEDEEPSLQKKKHRKKLFSPWLFLIVKVNGESKGGDPY